ncbi:phosphoenolpyruvate carboxykinase (ATP) [Anaerobacillus alkalidiazotrophicus]|uniref:Phosphoenolpyruvate carboxykinase (ATP) n=1 Tax=Anaerobacillus alkalidiazotrophicus TaxID=472963 RepID=A0A1S2M3S9_9BACI|nr:phosphoenolpyruvate carboxykinase (ATP) [Anaerobacillus alkalidiazotrophicus]OIJ19256.1 phosphoenolpyruvate carboxykinase (ATP) [Anaerobacillus alkalidiazotrophicus]
MGKNSNISLEKLLTNTEVYRNLSVPQLVEVAIKRGEGKLTNTGALRVSTGKYTGRSPKDKYIVKEPTTEQKIAWGAVNQSIEEEKFEALFADVLQYLNEKQLFVFDGFAGADDLYCLPITVVNEYAWHNLFAHQLFIRPADEELKHHKAQFTVVYAPGFQAKPEKHGTKTETFIIVNYKKKMVLIGGTEYAGEMKKSIFSVMNTILPDNDVLPMHCSANIGENNDVALFFGLSGTGKTTLSADPNRYLIGDDEHGWCDAGIFNFEGGCYAKAIHLSMETEPEIYKSVRFGAILENAIINDKTRVPDYDDNSLTENTRVAYPINHIDNVIIPGLAGHPNVIIFLTADAFGVLPPISKLTKEQAMYHFLSGYTSKLAGTERGVTKPQATFSTCFGAPFLPLYPSVYAKLLGENIDKYNTTVYLVNTGWTGGPYGVGKRMKLSFTRAMITAALKGELDKFAFNPDPIFGLLIPEFCPGVPRDVLNPRNTWPNKEDYDKQAKDLADRFNKNFEKLESNDPTIKSMKF